MHENSTTDNLPVSYLACFIHSGDDNTPPKKTKSPPTISNKQTSKSRAAEPSARASQELLASPYFSSVPPPQPQPHRLRPALARPADSSPPQAAPPLSQFRRPPLLLLLLRSPTPSALHNACPVAQAWKMNRPTSSPAAAAWKGRVLLLLIPNAVDVEVYHWS